MIVEQHEVDAPSQVYVIAYPRGWAAVHYGFQIGFGGCGGVCLALAIGTLVAEAVKWVFA